MVNNSTSKNSPEIFVLIDGNALVHRAFHAFPPNLATSKGQQVNAVYGFTSMLLKVFEEIKPKYVACAFDLAAPTFRHAEFVDYKAHRKPVDEGLISQFPIVKHVVKTFNIPIFEVKGFEADDVIGTLCGKVKKKKLQVIIVTGDQDTLQLVDDKVKVYMPGRTFKDVKLMGADEVEKKFGFGPELLPDYKGLRGDPSDNIPGVKGIGEKGAKELIGEYGKLKEIYKNLGKIKPRYAKLLKEGEESAFLSKKLAVIDCDVPLDFKIEDCVLEDYDQKEVLNLFQELEFRSLIKRLPKSSNAQVALFGDDGRKKGKVGEEKKGKYELLDSEKKVREFVEKLEKQKVFAFDTETTGTRVMGSKLVGASFSWKSREAYFVPAEHVIHNSKLRDVFAKIFKDPQIKKVGHNIKFDWHILLNEGFVLEGVCFDTMIAAYVLQGGSGRFGLKELAFNYLGEYMKTAGDLLKEENANAMDGVGVEKLADYACCDADVTWQLFEKFNTELNGIKTEGSGKGGWSLKRLFEEVEMPLVEVLLEMERNGIKLDREYLEEYGEELRKKLNEKVEEIYRLIGHEFNINSPQQVGEVLYEELGIKCPKRTGTGRYSTDERVLRDIAESHPVIEQILEHRELAKLRSTYVDSLLSLINKETGRIHTSFNQAVTATGRLSSTDPNLQNIPVASEAGRNIRRAFIAEKGNILVSFDYSQQELRLLAHMSGDKGLVKAFKQGQDIHAFTASQLFDVPLDKVKKEQREMAKTVNFGLLYGMGAFGLADRLKIPRDKATEFIDKYFDRYPSVKNYFDKLIQKGQKKGYIETIFGRRKNVEGLNSDNGRVRNAMVREAINFPFQGSAADMMKMAMIKVDNILDNFEELKPKILLQVHDELLFEVKKGSKTALGKFYKEISEEMGNVVDLDVPVKVDVKVGVNWRDLKEEKVK